MSHNKTLPKLKECIAYIEGCGWKLTNQHRMVYYFENPNANLVHRQMRFTLNELRHAFKYGW